MTDDFFEDINWLNYIAFPKPGRSIDDDDCEWTLLDNATVQQMTIFLLNEPSHVDQNTREKLAQLVNLARNKAKPDDNFLLAIGVPSEAIEKLRAHRIAEFKRRAAELNMTVDI